ncbi:ERICH1 isoform 10, partial [Pan troglodytes]
FLKSTQEMYFYDGVSRDAASAALADAASAALADAAEELLDRLASHSMPPSDVSILYHMKTLLLLQDTERLKHALEMFPEHCTMPPGGKSEAQRAWANGTGHTAHQRLHVSSDLGLLLSVFPISMTLTDAGVQ